MPQQDHTIHTHGYAEMDPAYGGVKKSKCRVFGGTAPDAEPYSCFSHIFHSRLSMY